MNIKNHYIEKGSGFPLILLHGNGENHSYFVHQIDYFSKNFRVIAIDTRGHGESPRGDRPFTIAQFAEDLKAFMDMHEICRAHIMGFSDGGNIALKFVLKYPERVDKLILNGANLCPEGVRRSVQIPIELGYKLTGLFSKRSFGAAKNHEMLSLMVNDPFIDAADLSKIKCETLVIAGTDDVILEKHTRLIADSIAESQLYLIKGDHFIANKKPGLFNRAVEEFLLKQKE